MNELNERRLKIVQVDYDFIPQMLNWWRNPPEFMRLPVTDELPEDCRVLDVHLNYACRCLDVVITSKSFPKILDGMMIETIPNTMIHEMQTISFRQCGVELEAPLTEK